MLTSVEFFDLMLTSVEFVVDLEFKYLACCGDDG